MSLKLASELLHRLASDLQSIVGDENPEHGSDLDKLEVIAQWLSALSKDIGGFYPAMLQEEMDAVLSGTTTAVLGGMFGNGGIYEAWCHILRAREKRAKEAVEARKTYKQKINEALNKAGASMFQGSDAPGDEAATPPSSAQQLRDSNIALSRNVGAALRGSDAPDDATPRRGKASDAPGVQSRLTRIETAFKRRLRRLEAATLPKRTVYVAAWYLPSGDVGFDWFSNVPLRDMKLEELKNGPGPEGEQLYAFKYDAVAAKGEEITAEIDEQIDELCEAAGAIWKRAESHVSSVEAPLATMPIDETAEANRALAERVTKLEKDLNQLTRQVSHVIKCR